METEIGSIFPIYDTVEACDGQRIPTEQNQVYLSLAREAFLYLAKTIVGGNHRIMLPAYTCKTVIDPFRQEKWDCHFYDINRHLSIETDAFQALFDQIKPEIVLFHPYYGCGISLAEAAVLQKAKMNGATIIADLTQAIFSPRDYPFVDYYVGSLRKWFPIPDGAFLSSDKHTLLLDAHALPENEIFVRFQKDAMYLRGAYFQSHVPELKQISIRLNKYAVHLASAEPIALHRISSFSDQNLLADASEESQHIRMQNYAYLLSSVRNCCSCIPVNDNISKLRSAPLYFPIYCPDRATVQKELASHGVYAPILWPVADPCVLISSNVRYIYDHILLIPIDQRYGIHDMERISKLLNREP